MATKANKIGKLIRKPAAKHLDPCGITNCRFCHDRVLEDAMGTHVCCFGLRGEGCIYGNPDMEHRLDIIAAVGTELTKAKYEADPVRVARTRNDEIDFPRMDTLNTVTERVAEITGKIYNFIYKGHEYTHNDNSMDFKSCPHCDSEDKYKLGYYGSGRNRIVCFECNNCFKKFYYHNPE